MRCWTFRTRPLEIQCEREATLLIEQLPETELLRLPLLLAHTLLPHSAPYSIHLYMTYNTILRARCERQTIRRDSRIPAPVGFRGTPVSFRWASLTLVPRALHSSGNRPAFFFLFFSFGRSSWHASDECPVYGLCRSVGAQ